MTNLTTVSQLTITLHCELVRSFDSIGNDGSSNIPIANWIATIKNKELMHRIEENTAPPKEFEIIPSPILVETTATQLFKIIWNCPTIHFVEPTDAQLFISRLYDAVTELADMRFVLGDFSHEQIIAIYLDSLITNSIRSFKCYSHAYISRPQFEVDACFMISQSSDDGELHTVWLESSCIIPAKTLPGKREGHVSPQHERYILSCRHYDKQEEPSK